MPIRLKEKNNEEATARLRDGHQSPTKHRSELHEEIRAGEFFVPKDKNRMSLAAGIIRAANIRDTPMIAQIHRTSWRAAYAGLLDRKHLSSMTVAGTDSYLRGLFKGKSSCPGMFVAVERCTGEIIGFIHGGAIREPLDDHQGEIYAFYVSPQCRGGGIGRKLFARMTSWFLAEGVTSFALWVLKDNPSCNVYEALAGIRCGKDKVNIGKRLYPVVAYSWKTAVEKTA